MTQVETSTARTEVRPFRVDVSEEDLVDLRQRIAATRWPDRETVPDRSQGAQLAELQELLRYWGTDYDWRKAEAQLNALPQFMTEIDGVDIHFFHVRSKHENALPLIVTHGWPGLGFAWCAYTKSKTPALSGRLPLAGPPPTKKSSGSIGKTRRTLRSSFPSFAISSARSMDGEVIRARRVRAPSRISTVTHIIFALLIPFTPFLSRTPRLGA
jgi:Epoxide hydrolase N terminus